MTTRASIFKLPPGVGRGALFALGLLVLLNLLLFSDRLVHRYGAVFAIGRAMDKQLYVEQHPPVVLAIGNSRVDNGISPRTMSSAWNGHIPAFNLGIPGANARVLNGMLRRLDTQGLLGPQKIRAVVLGLDESFLQADESLGYVYFFGDRQALWAGGEYRLWLGSWLRLWAYSDNLRQLREPDKALRFVSATMHPLEPVGGAAWRNLGYRAGFCGGQNEGQAVRQEVQAQRPPDRLVLQSFEALLDLLQARGIAVAVAFPPLLQRPSAYLDAAQADGVYARIRESLKQRNLTVLDEADPVPRDAAYFVNAGHLNDRGAQLYSRWLAERLLAKWDWLGKGDGR